MNDYLETMKSRKIKIKFYNNLKIILKFSLIIIRVMCKNKSKLNWICKSTARVLKYLKIAIVKDFMTKLFWKFVKNYLTFQLLLLKFKMLKNFLTDM